MLPHHSESIRLKNLATKLNICKLYREIFTDRESQFGFRGVDRSLQLNSDSSSANWLIGQRDIHYVCMHSKLLGEKSSPAGVVSVVLCSWVTIKGRICHVWKIGQKLMYAMSLYKQLSILSYLMYKIFCMKV